MDRTDRLLVVEIREDERVHVVADTTNTGEANVSLLKTRRGAMFRGTEFEKRRKGLAPVDLATLSSFVRSHVAAERGSTLPPANRPKDRRAQQAPREQRAPSGDALLCCAEAGHVQHAQHRADSFEAADLISTVAPAVASAVKAAHADVAPSADEPVARGTRRTRPFVFDFAAEPHPVMERLGAEGSFGAYVPIVRKELVRVGERHDVEILRARCPFHEPNREATLMIVPSLGRFACEACVHDGDVVDFVVAMERCAREDAEAILWNLVLKQRVAEARDPAHAQASALAPSAPPAPAPSHEVPWASYSLHCPLVVDAEGVRLVAYLPEELHQLFAAARRAGGIQKLIERAEAPAAPTCLIEHDKVAACNALGGVEMCQRLVEVAQGMGGVENLLDTVAMLRRVMARAS